MVQGCFPDALLQDKEEYEYFCITVSGEFRNRADNFFFSVSNWSQFSWRKWTVTSQSLWTVWWQNQHFWTPHLQPPSSQLLAQRRNCTEPSKSVLSCSYNKLSFLEALFPFLSEIFFSLQDLEGPSRTWEDLYCQEIPFGVSKLTFSIKLTDNTLESKLNSLWFEILSPLPSVVSRSNPCGLICLSFSISL